jgi:4-amino-4-deoxy-L-arabinose transferase-like glycosyltransferase
MVVHFSEYLRYAINTVYYRFEIFDAEGIVWQQAMLIPGPRMYGDINNYPFIVFHYPPLYHLVVRAISLLGCTPLFAGRAISLTATVVSAATISTLTWRLVAPETGRLAGLMGSAVSGLAFFCFFPVVLTSTLMRVDMLAIAFSFIGFLCFTTSRIHSWRPFAGMAFFVLAVFTKQTSIAAPLAAMTVTALIAPRQTLKILGFGLLLGAVPLSILMWMTNGGFLRHLVLYNINRYY